MTQFAVTATGLSQKAAKAGQTIKNSQSSSHLEDSTNNLRPRDRTLDVAPSVHGIKLGKDNPVSPNATALAKKQNNV